MKAATYSAVFGSGPSTFALKPACSSGNCTWPDGYHSLAVCNECANITNRVNKKCGPVPYGFQGQMCNYTLPSSLNISIGEESGLLSAKTGMPLIALNDTRGAIYTFSAIYARDESDTFQDPFAIECVLSYCAQRYTADVTAGSFTERVVDIWHADASVVDGGVEDYVLRPPVSFVRGLKPFTNLTLSSLSTNAIGVWFPGLFDGSAHSGIDYEVSYSSDTMQALFKAPNMSLLFDNLATAMTNNMRQKWVSEVSGLPGGAPAHGIAWRTETYVRVYWAWMALPIALLALTLVFLIATMTQNHRCKVMAWKSSSLAVLLHGVTDEDQRTFGGPLTQSREMNELAKGVAVQLRPESDGMRLRLA